MFSALNRNRGRNLTFSNPKEFYVGVLSQALNLIKLNTVDNNFDFNRFCSTSDPKPDDFCVGERVYFFNWFHEHIYSLYSAFSYLSDTDSKRLYIALILYRLCGHLCCQIPVSYDSSAANIQRYKNIEYFGISEIATKGMFDSVRHYDFSFKGNRYVVDCLGLEYYLYRGQYYYQGGEISICPRPGDIVIDGGAFMGDAASVFSNSVGPTGRVYAFDPVQDHLDIINFNISQFPLRNVESIPYALGHAIVHKEPIRLNKYSPGFNARGQVLPTISLNEFIKSVEKKRFDFLKLDVEGAEMDVLKGGVDAIAGCRATVAVSIYHTPNDFFDILNFLAKQLKNYSFHLGHYTIHREETVLYCRPLP